MPAPMTMRSVDAAGSSSVTAATHASAPITRPGQFGLRPWKTRAAFHTMPQATKPAAFSARYTCGPSLSPAAVHSATEAAPSRYDMPHHFSAGLFSCLPKNTIMAPSSAATIVATK